MKYSILVIQSEKTDYDAEIKVPRNKYFTTSHYNKFTNNILDRKITGKKLVNEFGLNEKMKTLATKKGIKKLATKTESKAEQDEIVKFKKHDSCLFIGQSYFVNDGAIEILFNTSTALFAEKVVS